MLPKDEQGNPLQVESRQPTNYPAIDTLPQSINLDTVVDDLSLELLHQNALREAWRDGPFFLPGDPDADAAALEAEALAGKSGPAGRDGARPPATVARAALSSLRALSRHVSLDERYVPAELAVGVSRRGAGGPGGGAGASSHFGAARALARRQSARGAKEELGRMEQLAQEEKRAGAEGKAAGEEEAEGEAEPEEEEDLPDEEDDEEYLANEHFDDDEGYEEGFDDDNDEGAMY